MAPQPARYIPALTWLTPLYDPVLKWVMQEEAFKRRLLAQANLEAGQQVLDLGCGTGTLTLMLKQLHPGAQVTGLDGDQTVLAMAWAKAEQAGLPITWDHGLATELPYAADTFDRVVSSLMLHHLTRAQKKQAFAEVLRVLRPDGEFHLVDFGPPHTFVMRVFARALRRLEETPDHFDGLLPGLLTQAGFSQVSESGHVGTGLGPLSLLQAVKRLQH
jgi:SAM-dependent methyltransferase